MIRKLLFIAALVTGVGFSYSTVIVDAQQFSQEQLSGAYIVKMVKFFFWENNTPQVCTTEGTGAEINETLKKLLQSSSNAITYQVKEKVPITELGECSLVFIGDGDETNLVNILLQTRSKPIATVSTISGFISRGGMFGLQFDSSGRIRAQVKPSLVQERGIKVNANLYEVMEVIK